ncbi:hypothetical protein IAR50_004220 [Cryptococcus sp. DSM 104548]
MTIAAQENSHPAFHLLVIPATFWGHMRPLFHLTLNLLELHPHIRATILLSPATSDRMMKDLSTFTTSEKKLQIKGGGVPISECLQVVTCDKESLVVYDAAAAQKDIEGYSNIIMDMCQFTVPDLLRKAVSEVSLAIPPVLVFCPISFSAIYS